MEFDEFRDARNLYISDTYDKKRTFRRKCGKATNDGRAVFVSSPARHNYGWNYSSGSMVLQT